MQQTLVTGLTPVRVARIKQLIRDLKAELDFLQQLIADERSGLNAVAEARYPFIKKASEATANYLTELAMPADEVAAIATSYGDFDDMHSIHGLFESLGEGISDTTMLLGAICYQKCLIVRKYAELAILRGVPGMEKVYQELSHLWERSSPPKENGKGANGGVNPPVPGNEPAA
jgi:hypothetical protein